MCILFVSEFNPKFVKVVYTFLSCKNLFTFFKETPVDSAKDSTVTEESASLKKVFKWFISCSSLDWQLGHTEFFEAKKLPQRSHLF